MRLLLPALTVCAVVACPAAMAQTGGSLFGTPGRVPPNPFASNYPSAAPQADPAYGRIPHRRASRRGTRPHRSEALRPPRDIPN